MCSSASFQLFVPDGAGRAACCHPSYQTSRLKQVADYCSIFHLHPQAAAGGKCPEFMVINFILNPPRHYWIPFRP
jgi:hypothetical protein